MLRLTSSEDLEVFALLPFRDFEFETRYLGFLDQRIVIDERAAESGAQALVFAQCRDGFGERVRQHWRRRFIRRVGRRPRIELALDPVEARENLRRHIKVRIRGRLAYPVLKPR